MHKAVVVALGLLLVGCGRGEGGDDARGNTAAGVSQTAAAEGLAGLYEGAGEGARRNRMCIVPGAGAQPRFGLIAWGQGDRNCTMAGEARRSGNALRLEADPECVFEARMEGTAITMPEQLPQGCAYYCGPGASLGGAGYGKTPGGDPQAAIDLAGDPLCG